MRAVTPTRRRSNRRDCCSGARESVERGAGALERSEGVRAFSRVVLIIRCGRSVPAFLRGERKVSPARDFCNFATTLNYLDAKVVQSQPMGATPRSAPTEGM